MRYGVIPESLLERTLLAFGLMPNAMNEAYAPLHARAIVLATELGVWDVIGSGGLTAEAVATSCRTHPAATTRLLNLLVTMRYLSLEGREYRLERHVRRWMLADARGSIRDAILMKRLEWRWMEGLEDFVRTGAPVNVHATMTDEDWGLYQRGMRAQAGLIAPLLVRQVPLPRGATAMLDIGGSHGYFSVVLCRRHAGLRAVVFDLPEAVQHAAPLLAREGMGDRVVHQAGNALTDEMGAAAYDLVLLFSLVHHFDDATNRRLVWRAARALRPGGVMVIGEALRPSSPNGGGQLGAFFDLYFGLTSQSGTWTFAEMASWQKEAGLAPRTGIPLRFASEMGLQVADKPGS
jgi:SAM-dependent methyltransferase